jgi:hypothetical protein
MFNFLIDNIFVLFGGRALQQATAITMDKIGAPLLAAFFYMIMMQISFKGLQEQR